MALQEKTEAPTQRKREEARDQGRVARSMDLISAFPLLAVLLMVRIAGPFIMSSFASLMTGSFTTLHTTAVTPDTIGRLTISSILKIAMLSLPIVLTAGAVGVVVNVMQVGMKIAAKPLAPDMSRISFFKGITKLVSGRSAVELLKSIAKVVIVGYVAYAYCRAQYPTMIEYIGLPVPVAAGKVGELCWGLLTRTCAALLVLAILDYMYQRVHFENTMRMTKQEVKEEYKRSEGDPLTKSRIRQRQREMSRRKRMLDDVPKADVIITNPTHIAVALKYDPDKMLAPIVLAKGQRLLAEKIKSIAQAEGIMIVENKPVARILFKVVEIGRPIPEELYHAVAEILAFVFRVSGKAGPR